MINTRRIPFALVIFLFLTGCRHGVITPGHYEGTLVQKQHGLFREQPVGVDFTYGNRKTAFADVRNKNGEEVLRLNATDLSRNGFQLSIPGLMDRPVPLRQAGDCFVFEGQGRVELCATADKFYLQISSADGTPLLSLSANQFAVEAPFPVEVPQDYSLAQVVNLAFQLNFDNRIEYEHVMQAKFTAKTAYLNLIPHFSLSTMMNGATGGFIGLLGSIGDLVPFLLPTRWFQAREASLRTQAEKDALTLMRLDLGTQVEGLVYALVRDQQILDEYTALLNQGNAMRDQIVRYEADGSTPAGTVDPVDSEINSMMLDLTALKILVGLDKAAVAQAIGMHGPEAVLNMAIGEERQPFETAVILDSDPAGRTALTRSFELRQLDFLIKVSHFQKTEVYFNWLDPCGDPSTNLGLGLGSVIAGSQSRIHELEIKREQIQSNIREKVYESVSMYDGAIQAAKLVQQGVKLQHNRLIRMKGEIKPGWSNGFDMEAVLQDYVASIIRRATVQASFRVARSKIDRFLLEGFYRDYLMRPGIMSTAQPELLTAMPRAL
jgi:hypothetical protein